MAKWRGSLQVDLDSSRKKHIETTHHSFIATHPVLTYYALVIAISWGSILLVFGPGTFLGTTEKSFVDSSPLVYLAFLAGPSVAGVLSMALVYRGAGIRDLGFRLLRWRVSVRWYAIALLTAPLLIMAVLFALSFTSPVFLPAFITSPDRVSLLLTGMIIGLVVPFFEELGWTGFAIPEARMRFGILATGLFVGLLWGLWHLPLFVASAASSGVKPPALFLAVLLFSWLPPYRVLMVWVYDRTQSLLVIMLMHLPIVVSQFALLSPSMAGAPVAIFDLVLAASLWLIVAALIVTNGGHLESDARRTR